jgi:hypothetical protein
MPEADILRRSTEPIIILAYARSGVARMADYLGQHPAIAHIPAVDLVGLCGTLTRSWLALEGGPDERPSARASEAIRSMVSAMVGTQLAGRSATHWSNCAICTVDMADNFARLYPTATFLCLHRSCRDTIYSGIAACPWGLTGYGFDGFAAAHPGNTVAALADYWCTHTMRLLEFEKLHPERCHRVRYEDLMSDEDRTMSEVYGAVDSSLLATANRADKPVQPPTDMSAPGALPRGLGWRFTLGNLPGPSSGHIGAGASVPVALIPDYLAADINAMHLQLGYERLAIGSR